MKSLSAVAALFPSSCSCSVVSMIVLSSGVEYAAAVSAKQLLNLWLLTRLGSMPKMVPTYAICIHPQ